LQHFAYFYQTTSLLPKHDNMSVKEIIMNNKLFRHLLYFYDPNFKQF